VASALVLTFCVPAASPGLVLPAGMIPDDAPLHEWAGLAQRVIVTTAPRTGTSLPARRN